MFDNISYGAFTNKVQIPVISGYKPVITNDIMKTRSDIGVFTIILPHLFLDHVYLGSPPCFICLLWAFLA